MQVDYRAFFLRPDTPPQGIPRPQSSGRPTNSPMRAAAEEAGLVMNRPPITSYTRLALEATEYAKNTPFVDAFHEEAYRIYWTDGKDLGRLEVIREVAERVGMDWSELCAHLEARTYKEEIERQHQEAMQVGVTGIPAFVLGRYFFMGAQPYELFKEVAERAMGEITQQNKS